MKLKTSRDETFDVELAVLFGNTGRMTVRLQDDRALSEVARDFDGLSSVSVEREDGWQEYDGPFALTAIDRYRNDNRIAIVMTREA